MQTKLKSLLESATNTVIGFVISLMATFIIFPLVGIENRFGQNFTVTMCFALISVVRGYIVRRCFAQSDKNSVTSAIDRRFGRL